jgi:hypothetical protein
MSAARRAGSNNHFILRVTLFPMRFWSSKMNRNNIWIHITIAVVVVTIAAVLGQINRWEKSLRVGDVKVVDTMSRVSAKHDPAADVLIKFRPGVSLDRIRQIASRNNDRLDDEIEAVNGLVSLDDMDDADASVVAAQYRPLCRGERAGFARRSARFIFQAGFTRTRRSECKAERPRFRSAVGAR